MNSPGRDATGLTADQPVRPPASASLQFGGMRGDRVLRLLRGVQLVGGSGPSPAAVMATLAEQAMGVGSVAGAAVAVVAGTEMTFLAASGSLSPCVGRSVPQDNSLCGVVARSGKSALSNDVLVDARVDAQTCELTGMASVAAVPVLHKGRVTAVILVGQPRPEMLGWADIEGLESLAVAASHRLQTADALEVAAASLAQSDAATHRLRAAMDSAIEGHTVYDAVLDESGQLVDLRNAYLNPTGAAARGISVESWLGGSMLADAAREGNVAVAQAYLEVARNGVPWSAQPQISTPLGRRTFAVSVVPTGPSPSGIMVSFRDIDDDHRAAVALAATVEMLDETQAMAGIGSWEWHIATNVVTFSTGMSTVCGTDPARLRMTGEDFQELVHPDDRKQWRDWVGRTVAQGGRSDDLHYRLVARSGQVRHLVGWGQVKHDERGVAVHAWGGAQNVTERVLKEQALAASEEQFRLALTHSPIGLAVIGLDGQWIQTNEALATIAGLTQPELLRSNYKDLAHPEDREVDTHLIGELLAGTSDSYEVDKRYRHSQGHDVWVNLHVAIVRTPGGEPMHYIAQIVDVTEQRRTTSALAAQAYTDPLTGLANRRAWEQGLHDLLEQTTHGRGSLVLAIVDLDHFKTFNDTFGHPEGDQLLCEATAAWATHLGEVVPLALLARLGGEEFGIAMPDIEPPAARSIVTGLLSLTPRGQTASAGITVVNTDDNTSTAMTRADAALYAAKRGGRNRCELLLTG